MFKYYTLVLAVALTVFTSCKKDSEETPAPTPTVVPKNTSVLVINAISDNSSAIAFKLDDDAVATIGADSYSAYIAASEGTRKLKFTVNGAAKELPVTIEKDKYYTLVVYGAAANPSVNVIEDKITTAPPANNFSYRYLNVYDSSVVKKVSAQAYYPSYKLWATVTGSHDNISFGTSSTFTNYTAGIEAAWRIIAAGSEESEPLAGYKAGSTNVVFDPQAVTKGVAGQHFTYVVFGHGKAGSYKLIVHEDQIAK